MRRFFGAFSLILTAVPMAGLALPVSAQTTPAGSSTAAPLVPPSPSPGRNVTATGKVMPPGSGRAAAANSGALKSSVSDDMLKAQKAAAARDKAWDSKMQKTMSSICSGC